MGGQGIGKGALTEKVETVVQDANDAKVHVRCSRLVGILDVSDSRNGTGNAPAPMVVRSPGPTCSVGSAFLGRGQLLFRRSPWRCRTGRQLRQLLLDFVFQKSELGSIKHTQQLTFS